MRTNRQSRRTAARLYRLCASDGLVDEARARLVIERVAASARHDSAQILTDFHRLLTRHRRRHTARVESAVELSAELRTNVQAALRRIYGPHLDIDFVQQPDVLGGMRVRVGDDVYDGTVRAALQSIAPRADLPRPPAAPPVTQTK